MNKKKTKQFNNQESNISTTTCASKYGLKKKRSAASGSRQSFKKKKLIWQELATPDKPVHVQPLHNDNNNNHTMKNGDSFLSHSVSG